MPPCFLENLRAMCLFFTAGDKWYKVENRGKNARIMIFQNFKTNLIIR